MAKSEAKKGSWGGARAGSGPKPQTDAEKLRRRMEREGLDDDSVDSVAEMAAEIGLSPRAAFLRPDLAERFDICPPGEHLDRFARRFCRYTQLGEVGADGPVLGDPYGLIEHEREFFDEALSCHPNGRRVYKRAGLVIPRKNRKTTSAAVLSLYLGSPADGEHRPLVVQAAGVLDQAGKLYETTRSFIDDPKYGSAALRRLFLPMQTKILCPSIAGEIRRVAGDGDNNHSLDPHAVVMDELHTWKTPKQKENLKALTTAQGGRLDPVVYFITTEGDGDENELALLMERIELSETTEIEQRRPGLTIYRDPAAALLVFRYAAPERVDGRPLTVKNIDEIKLANPAPWRTVERIREDLADPLAGDEATKLRLYANKRGGGVGRWITDAAWDACFLEEEPPAEAVIVVGADGARTRDTTAVGWAYKRADGSVLVDVRVWSTRPDIAHHVLVPGRLDNDLARDFVRDVLMAQYNAALLFYDERYFADQATDLSEDGMTVVEMHQGKPEMLAAWDEFYAAIHEGRTPKVFHNGNTVLKAHVKAAKGVKTERGWKVSKIDTGPRARPIDGLAAGVMARYGAAHYTKYVKPPNVALSW